MIGVRRRPRVARARPGGDGRAARPGAAHTGRITRPRPMASRTASRAANPREADGRPAGSTRLSPRLAQVPQAGARAEQGSRRTARRDGEVDRDGPPWRWRAWIGKLAAPTTRRKIRARE